MVPLAAPLQDTSTFAMLQVKSGGSVSVTLVEAVQPLASVTVKDQVPAFLVKLPVPV